MKIREIIIYVFAILLLALLSFHLYAHAVYRDVIISNLAKRADSLSVTLGSQIEGQLSQGLENQVQVTLDRSLIGRDFLDSVSLSVDNSAISHSSDRSLKDKPISDGCVVLHGSSYKLLDEDKSCFIQDLRYFEGDQKKEAKLVFQLDRGKIYGEVVKISSSIAFKLVTVELFLLITTLFLAYRLILIPLRKIIQDSKDKSNEKRDFFISELTELQNSIVDGFIEIQDRQGKLDLIVKTMPDLIWLKNPYGIYMMCNPPFERFFGAKESEIVGKSDFDFVPHELAEFFRQKDKDAMLKDSLSANEEWVTFKSDGISRLLYTIKTPLKALDGRLVGILGIARDITELHQANQQIIEREELFSAIVKQTNEAIVLMDIETFAFVEFNDPACSTLGYSREEFETVTLMDIQADSFDKKGTLRLFEEVKNKGGASFEHKHKCKDGTIREVHVSNKIVNIRDKEYMVAVWYDMTEINKTKNELESLNISLEQRVQEELTKNREKDMVLIKQSRLAAMGETISNIAHQWRQPLNVIALNAQDLTYAYEAGEINAEYVKQLKDSTMTTVHALSKTIDDFRRFFRPDGEKALFDVVASANVTLTILGPTLASVGIVTKIESSEPYVYVMGFEHEFSQLLANLINNAKDALSKKEGDPKNIDILIEKIDNMIRISVRDNGNGISEEIIDKVFDPYFTTKHQSQGVGLGLFMAKMIIEQHMEGRIFARNLPSGGAEFVVEF